MELWHDVNGNIVHGTYIMLFRLEATYSRMVEGRNDDAHCCILTLCKGIRSAFLRGYRSWD